MRSWILVVLAACEVHAPERPERAPTLAFPRIASYVIDTHITPEQAVERPVADDVERIQHFGAKLARFFDDRAYRCFVEALRNATLDQVRQSSCRLEREHNVVYGSPVSHLVVPETFDLCLGV